MVNLSVRVHLLFILQNASSSPSVTSFQDDNDDDDDSLQEDNDVGDNEPIPSSPSITSPRNSNGEKH